MRSRWADLTRVKRDVRVVRPREPADPVVKFETPPAHQAQVNFATFRLPWGKRHALIVVLVYSRRMWLRFYWCQTLMVVIRGIEEAEPADLGRMPGDRPDQLVPRRLHLPGPRLDAVFLQLESPLAHL